MNFILPFQINSYPFKISYRDNIFLIGSCFSEEIGKKLKDLKFNMLQNPNGILYDPLSIADSLFSYIENNPFDEKNLFELNGLWHSWKHHSVFSGADRNHVLTNIRASQAAAHAFLKEATFLIITLGTAFYYQLKGDQENVANCHKAPANLFERSLITTDEIITEMLSVLTAIQQVNPGLKIIFTVSPVKHARNGVVENNRSKARLIEGVHAIAEQRENVFYFPSYELVTDILRDYRFYKNDLVHPNETAIDFVFEKFCDSFLDNEEKIIADKIKGIVNAANHRPFSRESEAHQRFVDLQLKKIQEITRDHPFVDLSMERKYFLEQAKHSS